MRILISIVLALALAAGPLPASSRGAASTRSRSSASHSTSSKRVKHPAPAARHKSSVKCVGCERDAEGRIARSEKAKESFRKTHPCPATGRTSGPCPGYQVDHTTPLYKGGSDTSGNMQWLTDQQHKAKHRELK